ncbi:methionine ABC transporter ATP-binding protein [Brevibacterium sp. R8603A2]|uniref:methionine ABC transporter ATP-binding protein n=1 Tax=unclassified Brevibacterium TaxID=2614124 RepID=UPI001FF9FA53|nr:methionine ABC transporter ATP-binding protein [Brevibacterium sp. R8603A2]
MSDIDPHIRFISIFKEYPSPRGKESSVKALDGVSLDIARGSVVGIVGYSGAGKSTLVRLINGLELPTSGSVVIDGTDITGLPETKLQKVRSRIGMIFQHFNLFGSRTVAGNVGYPLKIAGWSRENIKARVTELLRFVDLEDKADVYPRRLSGGQKQRVGIARALATSPEILLADEATSALDPETTTEVLGLLRRVNQEFGTTTVVITHEMAVVRELCDNVVMMEKGRIIEAGSTYSLFSNPVTDTTRKFIATATQGTPSAATLERLRARHPGTIVAIEINEEYGSSEVNRMLAAAQVTGTVVFGGVTEIGERPLGTLTYELTGPPEAITAAIEQIAAHTRTEVLSSQQPQKEVSHGH